MGNGRRTRRHVTTEKVCPDKPLPVDKPLVVTEITTYAVSLDAEMNDLSTQAGSSNTQQMHVEPGIKYEVIITAAHKKYIADILPSHDEIQECVTALFRRTIEKKIRNQNKKK